MRLMALLLTSIILETQPVSANSNSIKIRYQQIRIHALKKSSLALSNVKTFSSPRNIQKIKNNFKVMKGGINPADTLCKNLFQGSARVFTHPTRDEESICYYSDKSYFFTWDLVKKAF